MLPGFFGLRDWVDFSEMKEWVWENSYTRQAGI